VVRVNEDNLVIFVDTILIDPVGVQHPQISASLANTLLCRAPKTTLELQVVNTLADRLAVGSTCAMQELSRFKPCLHRIEKRTLGHRLFAVTAPDADTVYDISLLGFITETTSFIGARRA
jgi:hypothetical protein